MNLRPDIRRRLRNVSAGELVRALERDGFRLIRSGGSSRVYRTDDGRQTILHFHRASDTLPIGTLRDILDGTEWTAEDVERLGLI